MGHAGRARRGRDHRRGGRAAPGRAAAVHRDLPGAGGAEPAGRPVLEGRGSRTGGRPPRRTGSPRSPPVRWITAGSGTRCTRHPGAAGGGIGQKIAARVVQVSGADVSSVALDMTNFATFIATANGRAPIAQRGKAKQKRADLRLVGLGLVVTRDGGIPLTWHAYPGDRPDVTQFPDMIDQLQGPVRGGLRGGRGRCGGRGDDRRVRRRAELRGELRAPRPDAGCTTSGRSPPATART